MPPSSSSSFFPSTFVSSYSTLHPSACLSAYLTRKKLEFVEHANKFTLKYCPNCPDHKHRRDNLFKLEVFKNSGNTYCHRCGWKGSLFDLKTKLGDLNPHDILATLQATPQGGEGRGGPGPAGGGFVTSQYTGKGGSPFGCMYTSPSFSEGVVRGGAGVSSMAGRGLHPLHDFSYPGFLEDIRFLHGDGKGGVLGTRYKESYEQGLASQTYTSYYPPFRNHLIKSPSPVYTHPPPNGQQPSSSPALSIFRLEAFEENLQRAMEKRRKKKERARNGEEAKESVERKTGGGGEEEEGDGGGEKKNKKRIRKNTSFRQQEEEGDTSRDEDGEEGCGERVLKYLTQKRGLDIHTVSQKEALLCAF